MPPFQKMNFPCFYHRWVPICQAASSSRPVSKVVSFLQGMKEQLESEASAEAELMEKYNCWCKDSGNCRTPMF